MGLGYTGLWPPLQKVIDLARQAEQADFDSVWISEERNSGRDAFSTLACIGHVTRRIRLGTAVVPVHARHLYLLAGTVAAVDEISRGRLILGIGASKNWPSYPEGARPLQMMRTAVRGLRLLLAGEMFEYQGKELKLQEPGLWESLPQVRSHIPIYMGCIGPKMTQLAGQIADGIIIGLFTPPAEIAQTMRNLQIGARRAGRNLSEIEIACLICVAASAEGWLDERLRAQTASWFARRMTDEMAAQLELYLEAVADVRAAVAQGGHWAAAARVTRPMVEAITAVGSPQACLMKIQEYRRAGVKLPILVPFGGDPNLVLEIGAGYVQGGQPTTTP